MLIIIIITNVVFTVKQVVHLLFHLQFVTMRVKLHTESAN